MVRKKTEIDPLTKFEKKINIMEFITLITLIIGGILGYFLNNRYETMFNQSDIKLNEINLRIAEVSARRAKSCAPPEARRCATKRIRL